MERPIAKNAPSGSYLDKREGVPYADVNNLISVSMQNTFLRFGNLIMSKERYNKGKEMLWELGQTDKDKFHDALNLRPEEHLVWDELVDINDTVNVQARKDYLYSHYLTIIFKCDHVLVRESKNEEASTACFMLERTGGFRRK